MSIYKNKKIIVLFLAPVTIGLLVFVYYPLIQTIIGSLYKWVSYSPDRKWVGIANYLAIFQKKGFLRILFNNTIYAILSVVCQVGLAMVMAACLEEIFMRKFQKFFRTVLFIPSLISMSVIGLLWKCIFNPNTGPLNQLLVQVFHVQNPPGWLGDASLAIFCCIFISQWQNVGYCMLLDLIGIQKIPQEIHDAALIDADTNSNISCAKEEITLVDTVSFKGLVPNQKYEVTGTLIDKETKKPVEADGKPVTAKASFKPKESAGTVDVTFTFDASSLKGKTVVVFESLAYKDKEVAVHTDIADEGQTIYFPEIKTTATDAASGTHYAKPEKELTLTDLVEYKNLIPGKEYKLTGTLMDAETEKPFDVDGKAVTAETSFTPEEANGSVELSFTFDASALSGKTLVAFETMTFEDHEVAVHADIKDANQTIYFPEIKTTAKDGSDGDQDVSASKEATIVDTVTYHGLMPGSEYKVIGTLMNKETGEALLKDGKPVTAQAEFKAEKAGGSVEVTFTFDASALAGQDVVVFEKLYYTDGKTEHEIASHEDLKDEGQTVHMTELPKEPETPPVAPPVKTGDETPLLLYAGIAIAALAGASVLGIVYFKRKKKHQ